MSPHKQEKLNSSATVSVEVVDINDNNPVFQRESFTAEIQETALPGRGNYPKIPKASPSRAVLFQKTMKACLDSEINRKHVQTVIPKIKYSYPASEYLFQNIPKVYQDSEGLFQKY
jgi:hypothetical protein